MTRCGKCGRHWTGHKTEHCTGCHQSFTSTTAGDKHRVGKHDVTEGPERRRCLTPDEMLACGMAVNTAGVWASRPKGLAWEQSRPSAPHSPPGT